MLRNVSLLIYGDGEQTRDFVHVDDVVQANINVANAKGVSGAFYIASGTRITINHLVEMITKDNSPLFKIEYGPIRHGDVRQSLADIGSARKVLGYEPQVKKMDGLKEYITWVKNELRELYYKEDRIVHNTQKL